ncbi:MAG: IS1595 family transposase [Psychromonas sp.]
MSKVSFTVFQQSIEDLSYIELKRLNHQIEVQLSKNEVGQVLAKHENDISKCPHCSNCTLSRWGSTNQGKQRYRCKNCSKTFSTLTGTNLFRMKKPDKWLKYIECLCLSNSLRYAANLLNINLKTAFRWRHRLLKSPCAHKPTELVGIIEADETFVPESFKGSKKMPRESRKRGGGNPPKVPILLALDRNGAVSHYVLNQDTKEELSLALKPLLTPDSVLCTDGNLSYKSIVQELDFSIDHKRLIGLDKQKVIDKIYHIQTLNNFMMRWKTWMKRFFGVGTGYMEHYIAWFIFMENKESYKNKAWLNEALE